MHPVPLCVRTALHRGAKPAIDVLAIVLFQGLVVLVQIHGALAVNLMVAVGITVGVRCAIRVLVIAVGITISMRCLHRCL